MEPKQSDMLRSYDLVAADYAENFRDELASKPFDRRMLDWLIDKVGDIGPICDMGCGPGQIARYLYDCGASVCGIDFSPRMLEQARLLNPEITFADGDMLDLHGVPDASFGGIAAFYSIVNIPPPSLPQAFWELHRVLVAKGILLLTYHVGDEIKHLDEWWGKPVNVDFYFYDTANVKRDLKQAGFTVEEIIEREPYPDVEYPSRRAYVFAMKQ